jgi:hypothetical protein
VILPHCPLCNRTAGIQSAPEPLLEPEDRALAAMAGTSTRLWWIPGGTPIVVCNAGHVTLAPEVDLESAKRAALDVYRLRGAVHLTGSERRRLGRAVARLDRFASSQIRFYALMVKLWNDLARLPTVDFLTHKYELPLTPEDMQSLEGEA